MLFVIAVAHGNEPRWSPAEVWAGYDPTALPLEVESLSKWNEGEPTFEKLRFTAEVVDGQKARVFAIRGLPPGNERVPGILHIHGGGQTASLDWVKFWTERGYACATYDFCGPWADRTEVTDWGPVQHANMQHAAGGYQVHPTPRESSWYHWTLCARRALTLLASDPRVDAERLGIFGISMGGTLCWMVAGTDDRVKAAAPIYGCGYNLDREKARFGFAELTPDQQLFQRAIASEAYAPYIRCPVLFLNATNDFHGWMDPSYRTLAAVKPPHWQACTPRFNHHIAAAQAANLPLFMDWQLRGGPAFPESPRIELRLDGSGVPRASVAAKTAVKRVDVYYALGDQPSPNRFWRHVTAENSDPWRAALPVVDTWQPLVAFANVQFESGACLTTNLARVVPGELGIAKATLAADGTIDSRVAAESWYFVTANTDPNITRNFTRVVDEGDHGPAVRLDPETFPGTASVYLGTHIISDPQFLAPGGTTLTFDLRGTVPGEAITVTLRERDWTPLAKIYTCQLGADRFTNEWTTIELRLADFRTADSQVPADWRRIDVLQLQGTVNAKQDFRIARLRWVPNEAPAPAKN